MLLQLLTHHPEAAIQIVRQTPSWVWGLLVGLLALGICQLRDRTASATRVALLPLVMTMLSVSGAVSALGKTPHLAMASAVWLSAAALAFALLARGRSQARFHRAQGVFFLPGSAVPLLLIVGIFLVKYVVGVDLAMAPQLVRDPQYVSSVAALYGAFTGLFVGRAAQLWRVARRPEAACACACACA